ncbi:MAG: quinone-dependent dihydroorotate dehydrogenase [Rickettsiales bacterium]
MGLAKGKTFKNPVGMAAGFDKNAEAYNGLLKVGCFGFVEVGTITPKAQSGNPTPRMFRLIEDEAVINRLGFNNEGKDRALSRLQTARHGIVGVNIGKNKDTVEAIEDYLIGLKTFYPVADYITVNISSPNTEGLRALQQRDTLRMLVTTLKTEQKNLQGKHQRKVPMLVKIAPDLTDAEMEQILDVAQECNVEGLILTNTTTARSDALKSKHKGETGGLSGQPLKARSLEVMKKAYKQTGGRMPLIGVGGVGSAQDAIERMQAGASLVQLYTAMVYRGPHLITEILKGIQCHLDQRGLASVNDLVGMD